MISPPPHPASKLNILLADDDKDDCLLFKEALEELQLQTTLTLVHNGQHLLNLLKKDSDKNFDVLFLDLNMPRINGFECLEEIKRDDKLKSLPVIIFSTSNDLSVADKLYNSGAQHFISKPSNYSILRKIIQEALFLVAEKNSSQPPREKFLLRSLKIKLL